MFFWPGRIPFLLSNMGSLTALDYHKKTAAYFQQQQQAWSFFSTHHLREEQLKDFKTGLLKNSYRFTEAAETGLYEKVKTAKEKLELSLPVILYQAEHTAEMGAGIAYLDNEAHIVFSGNIIQHLSGEELLAVIGHELSHVHLYTQQNGEVEVADRMVSAIANHHGTTPAHYETARLFRLYTEIFCDRGAYMVTGHYAPIISSLVKLSTGLNTVNADSYIQQAEDIFSADAQTKTSGISHPENFIRARAIWFWHSRQNEADTLTRQMIEGHTSIEDLDLFKQQEITQLTEQLVQLILQPEWMKTPNTLALAKQYFNHFSPNVPAGTGTIAAQVQQLHNNLQDYLAYVLYDFATNDKQLEDVPMGYCFYIADELNMSRSFAATVKKEKKLTDKKLQSLKKQTLAEYQNTVNKL